MQGSHRGSFDSCMAWFFSMLYMTRHQHWLQFQHIATETKWSPFCRRISLHRFCCMKTVVFGCKFHWTLFSIVQLTHCHHWFRKWLGDDLIQWWPSFLTHLCVTHPRWVNVIVDILVYAHQLTVSPSYVFGHNITTWVNSCPLIGFCDVGNFVHSPRNKHWFGGMLHSQQSTTWSVFPGILLSNSNGEITPIR